MPFDAPKHRLLFELGRGGMGTVFLAVTEGPAGFSKLKVVKRLRADLASDTHFLQMFLDEARLSARLSHPNVVQTNEVGFDGSHYFLEMEHLDGSTFDAILRAARDGSDVKIAYAIFVLTQVLAGLHYAHELTDHAGTPLSVVHRDVSPQNVMVTYDGAVKVLDFGIAKAADSGVDTRTGVVKGKVNYMAPEQAARRKTDRRADVFAVGVMLWQALTRRRLWADLTEGEIFVRLERGEIPAPRAAVPEIPEALDAICVRAIAKDPSDRFATAEEFQHALEGWLDASGERSGARELAALMHALFAERRVATKRRIEARLFGDGARPSDDDVDVPILVGEAGHTPTRSREVGPVTVPATRELAHRAATPTIDRGAGDARSLATFARRAALAVVVAGLGAASFVVARGDATKSATAASTIATLAPVECRMNTDCAANGAAICRSGACVPLASEDCSILAEPGDVESPATLWIGAMFPLSGDDAKSFGRANANAADLARRDFATMSSGLPSVRPGGAARPVALVMCDDAVNPNRAARHLVDDVGVPAVIGFHRSKELVDLATSLFVPKQVAAFAALNASPLVTRVAQPEGTPRLVWRTTVRSTDWVVPVGHVVTEVFERDLRASGVLGSTERMRVAVARLSNSATLSSADAIFSTIRFNGGKSALENGDDFRQVVFGDSVAGAPPDYARAAAELVAFAPHVVIYIDPDVFTSNVLAPLEDAWPKTARFRPRYVTGGAVASDSLARFIGASAERRQRFLAVDLPASTATNVKLSMRYNEIFSPKVTPATAPGVAYDAFYVAAYAAFASGNDSIDGASIARGIARLVPPGVRVDVGPTHVFDAFEALRAGTNIDLEGASTKLDFDLATGESQSDFAVYCSRPSADGRGADAIESGLVYRAGAATLEGTMRCTWR